MTLFTTSRDFSSIKMSTVCNMVGSKGAKVSLLGIFPEPVAIPWDLVIFKGLILKGIYGREMFETWYKMSSMIRAGLDISPIITHQFHYTEYETAFQTMISGQSGKVVLDWTE